ncbi:MAG: PhzF family phenazine biosynthesis protein, partial [Chitinophagales bacterium]
FQTKSGLLTVRKDGEWITMNFPADHAKKIELSFDMRESLRMEPTEVYQGRLDFLAVFPSQSDVLALNPDFVLMKKLGKRGVIVTAKGYDVDFVSRYFAPNAGINEDPVTGSAHCVLVPYWSDVLKKTELTARQVSQRGGFLKCKLLDDRVEMSGRAATYLAGEVFIAETKS